MKEEQTKKQPSSTAHRVWTVVGVILCVILIPILLINCTLILKGYTKSDEIPSIGGVFPMIVLTDSMSGEFDSGDLILCRQADPDSIRVGDIICFYDPMGNGTTTVTHRVTEITQDADGGLAWKTKGDANNVEDLAVVPAENLAGVYLRRLPGLGSAALFLQSTPGLILCVLCPILLLVGYDMVRRRMYEKRSQQDTDALLQELETLRAEKAAQEDPKE